MRGGLKKGSLLRTGNVCNYNFVCALSWLHLGLIVIITNSCQVIEEKHKDHKYSHGHYLKADRGANPTPARNPKPVAQGGAEDDNASRIIVNRRAISEPD